MNDYNGDGLVDPILEYGTFGINGTSDERNTQVDELYYQLPTGIQNRVQKIMESITDNDHGIFPYGWQTAMKNQKLRFDEN